MPLSTNKLVVMDFDIPQLFNNKIFIANEAVKVHHTILPTVFLYERANERGIELVTPDVFLNLNHRPKRTLLMSHLITPYTTQLIATGAKPVLLTCQESPFIATRFYVNLRKYSSWFRHSMVFAGMRKQLSNRSQYHQMYFPESFTPSTSTSIPFAQKKFLTMISGNKRIGSLTKTAVLKLLYGFGVQEIYNLRTDVIEHFAGSGEFDLYGRDWNIPLKNPKQRAAVERVYHGTVGNKLDVLRNYKFAFCFENSIFPGYITEKIFDVLFAGSVPVYCGAPDIKDYVPQEAFIDVRKFSNLAELDSFLHSVSEAQYSEYLNRGKEFLASQAFYKFSQEDFAENVLSILEEEFSHHE